LKAFSLVPEDLDELRCEALDAQGQKVLEVPQALSAFDQAQVADDAIGAVAHLGQSGALEVIHLHKMQFRAMASILDTLESTEACFSNI